MVSSAGSKVVSGVVARLAVVLLGASACYPMTPHRAEIAASANSQACQAAIGDVFTRSGFIQLAPPNGLSMLFSARVGGPYSGFLRTGSGVGVTIDPKDQAGGTCHVTLEALSPDASCVTMDLGQGLSTCGLGAPPSASRAPYRDGAFVESRLCPAAPILACELTSAPGPENDKAIDELARRLRTALGPSGRVD